MPNDDLQVRFSFRVPDDLARGVQAYCNFTDITPSRLFQRAVERELARQARSNPKLKQLLEKAMKNGTTTGNNRAE